VPRAGESTMTVEKIAIIPQASTSPTIPGDPDLVGVVRASRNSAGAFPLDPDPMRLEVVEGKKSEIDLASFNGRRVAIDAGRRGRKASLGLIQVTDITPLQSKSFFSSMPSMSASRAGILPAVVGTILVTIVTMVLAVPLGVAAGVYLEEYAPKNRITALIEINIANLAGVPSIIWGLAGLALFIFAFHMERSVLAAGLTLGLLVLPIVIIASREAIRAVPNTIREAAIGLGATKWQATRYHVLPYSMSGILTGSIIALSRAIGETAPLVCIGAVVFITFLPPPPIQRTVPPDQWARYEEAIRANPDSPAPQPPPQLQVNPFGWLNSKFTVLPMQVFDWVSRPQREFHANAAAASIVLVVLTLTLNGIAIAIRYRTRRSIKW
jgi:phosphate transport system permease protein